MGCYSDLQGKLFGPDWHQIDLAGSWDTPIGTWDTPMSGGIKHNGWMFPR